MILDETLEAINSRLNQYLDRFGSLPDSLSAEKLVEYWKPVKEIQGILEEFWEEFDKKFPPIKQKGGSND